MAKEQKIAMTIHLEPDIYAKLKNIGEQLQLPLNEVVYMIIDNIKVEAVTVEFSLGSMSNVRLRGSNDL